MKKLVFLFGIIVCTIGAFAQDSSMNMQDTGLSKMTKIRKDCYLMKDGKMMMMKQGDTTKTMMDKAVTLNNGAMIMMDGTVKMADGASKMLKEGWYIDMDGKMGSMKKTMKKDKM